VPINEIELEAEIDPQKIFRLFRLSIGYLIAAACLGWVLYHVHPGQLIDHVRNMNWPLIALAIAFNNLIYVCQGVRWRFLLWPLMHTQMTDTIQAIYVGFFTNEILPLRFGEVARAYLLGRWYSAKFADILPSVILERLLDAGWLMLGIGITAFFAPLTANLVRGAQLFGIIVVTLAAIFMFAVFQKGRTLEHHENSLVSRNLTRKISAFLEKLAVGLQRIGFSLWFFLAALFSFMALAMESVSLWLAITGYGLSLTFLESAAVLMIVRIGTALPNAPANIGTYQFFMAMGLHLFGIDKSVATNFSLVIFFVLSVPLWIIGFLALSRSGMDLLDLRHGASEAAKDEA
jgi:uncharacterized protein (TIRG00374 family)